MRMAPTEPLLSSREVADLLGCSVWTVARIPEADLPVAVKAPGVRGARMYRRADVEALLLQRAS